MTVGYILKPYLVTPYRQLIYYAQGSYNYANKKTRVRLNKRLVDGSEDIFVFMARSDDGKQCVLSLLLVVFFIILQ